MSRSPFWKWDGDWMSSTQTLKSLRIFKIFIETQKKNTDPWIMFQDVAVLAGPSQSGPVFPAKVTSRMVDPAVKRRKTAENDG